MTPATRERVLEVLRSLEFNDFHEFDDSPCRCSNRVGIHDVDCELARLLLEVGGEAERQRQVDEAHAQVLHPSQTWRYL